MVSVSDYPNHSALLGTASWQRDAEIMTGFSFCPPEGLGMPEPLAAVPARSVPLSHSTTLLNTKDHIQQHWRSDLRDSHPLESWKISLSSLQMTRSDWLGAKVIDSLSNHSRTITSQLFTLTSRDRAFAALPRSLGSTALAIG